MRADWSAATLGQRAKEREHWEVVVPFADVPTRAGLVSRSGDRPAWPVPDRTIAADVTGVGGFLLRTNSTEAERPAHRQPACPG